ncbi:hypothetical protein VSS37_03500 [Candidatus Thiothrix sp. Deng01]|uniref:Uncharacterized protein n=1 Tax=Candidatus Thiothrix phosphatis TaxID=3112415 RepID=A0ABU6CT76_9GAMM|nr:hypothetical protein [Candidatus Thiothrix sp. Deng01]MEB4590036.1 hypothetical protein [Candidatus Thiothrix sp. Deng01]
MNHYIDFSSPNTRQNLPKASTYGLSGNHGELTGRAYRRALRSCEQAIATQERLKARKRKALK